MRVDITELSEEDVVLISVMLDDNGFRYDEDYTTLYGPGWTITGVRIMSVQRMRSWQRPSSGGGRFWRQEAPRSSSGP